MEALKEIAKFEGYMDAASAEFAALEKKLNHDLDRDFDYFEKDIKLLLADEIVTRYYYQRGSIIQAVKSDSTLHRAQQLLNDKAAYTKLLEKPSRK